MTSVSESPRSGWWAAILTLIGMSAAGLLVWAWPKSVPRPEGSGQVGILAVYAQTPYGPVRLRPRQPVRLYRPQDFVFLFQAEGTGPRYLRLEIEAGDRHWVQFEEKVETPFAPEYLGPRLRMGEEWPDEVLLRAVVEAPHMMSAISEFPILLIGKSTPFWEQVPDAGP